MLTQITLTDVNGKPSVKTDLPRLRLSDRVKLSFKLQRANGGRLEQLDVDGEFRVSKAILDASGGLPHPVLELEATGISPTWKSIKGTKICKSLAPAKNPRTPIT